MTDTNLPDPFPLIPMAERVAALDGPCRLAATVVGDVPAEIVERCAKALREATAPPSPDDVSELKLAFDASRAELGDEGYELVLDGSPHLKAATELGLMHGVESLRQLTFALGRDLPGMRIVDRPRFGWRGLMVDSCRHFWPVETILKLIDAMALHRLNRLHWHLTDDQGWRIEIKAHPRLTGVGSRREQTKVGHYSDEAAGYDGRPYGGYYTQDDVRRVVAYARQRGITVVPEIDLPGHMQAAIAAYPELGNGLNMPAVRTTWGISRQVLNAEPATIAFLEEVLSEVLELFDSPWVHLGGDETPTDEWERSDAAARRAEALGYDGPGQLQRYFIDHFAAWLAERGRRMMGWDEVWERSRESLPEGSLVVGWRGESHAAEAAKAGYDVVMAPGQFTYFDKYQVTERADEPLAIGGVATLSTVVGWEPIPEGLRGDAEASRRVFGGQGQLWSEYILSPAHLDYMAFPRACALAEALWSTPEARQAHAFKPRLERHVALLDFMGIGYRPLDEKTWAASD